MADNRKSSEKRKSFPSGPSGPTRKEKRESLSATPSEYELTQFSTLSENADDKSWHESWLGKFFLSTTSQTVKALRPRGANTPSRPSLTTTTTVVPSRGIGEGVSTVAVGANSGAGPGGGPGLLAKDYWMQDEDCIICYDCQAPFTTFRRRHHCRVCGQIFCWKCSSKTVDGRPLGQKVSLRVCNYCYDIIKQRFYGNQGTSFDLYTGPQPPVPPPPPTPGFMLSALHGTSSADSSEKEETGWGVGLGTGEKVWDKEKGPPRTGGVESLLSNKYQPVKLGEATFTQDEMEGDEHVDESPYPVEELELYWDEDPLFCQPDDAEGSLSTLSPRSPSTNSTASGKPTRRSLFEDKSTKTSERSDSDTLSTSDAEAAEREASAAVGLERRYSDGDVEVVNKEGRKGARVRATLTNAHMRLPTIPQSFHDLGNFWSNWKEQEDAGEIPLPGQDAQATYEHFCEAGNARLKEMVSELVHLTGLEEQWVEIIMLLALQAVDTVRANVLEYPEEENDLREYVRVKTIPGGEVSECSYVDGIVFSKNVVHKEMRTRITNPKVMLLKGAIDADNRKEPRLQSFDILLKQEKQYLRMLIHKIASFKPDVVFSQKAVAGIAQEYLLRENISVGINVKPQVMRRLARMSGGNILPSTESLRKGRTELSEFMLFHVETFKGKWGRKTLMYFSGLGNDDLSLRLKQMKLFNMNGKKEPSLLRSISGGAPRSTTMKIETAKRGAEDDSALHHKSKSAQLGSGRVSHSREVPRELSVSRDLASSAAMAAKASNNTVSPTTLSSGGNDSETVVGGAASWHLESMKREVPYRREGTVVLRGADRFVLLAVKRILLFTIYAANHLRYERHLFFDLYAVLGEDNSNLPTPARRTEHADSETTSSSISLNSSSSSVANSPFTVSDGSLGASMTSKSQNYSISPTVRREACEELTGHVLSIHLPRSCAQPTFVTTNGYSVPVSVSYGQNYPLTPISIDYSTVFRYNTRPTEPQKQELKKAHELQEDRWRRWRETMEDLCEGESQDGSASENEWQGDYEGFDDFDGTQN